MIKSKNQTTSKERDLADIENRITEIFSSEVKPCSFLEFVKALQKHNILVHPNLTKNGHISGCRFEFEGISFKGSAVGYPWGRLIAAGIRYNPLDADRLRVILDNHQPQQNTADPQSSKHQHALKQTVQTQIQETRELIQQLESLKSAIENAKAEKSFATAKVAEVWQKFHDSKIQLKVCENHLINLQSELRDVQQEVELLRVKRNILGFDDRAIQNVVLDGTLETLPLDQIARMTHEALLASGNLYSLDLIQDFTALLAVNDFIVLAGNPGNGKTSLCREYARVTGSVCHVIPVKPNWTSTDDLLGYYSPIEKGYISTPFLNALLEAAGDPSHLHLICLDEINLARPEYYFSDFLSVLENRSEDRFIEINIPKQEQYNSQMLRDVINTLPDDISIDTNLNDILSNNAVKTRLYEILKINSQEELNEVLSNLRQLNGKTYEVTGKIHIPSNVRFIGTMNVDETTNFFAPKILDRAHILRLENPLFAKYEYTVPKTNITKLHVSAKSFGQIEQYPVYNPNSRLVVLLKKLAEDIFIPLNIDLSLRTVRQALLYEEKAAIVGIDEKAIFSNIIRHKLLPKCVFDIGEVGSNTFEYLQKFVNEWTNQVPESCLKEFNRLISMSSKTHTINWWLE